MSQEIRILLASDIHLGAGGPIPARIRINTLKRIASLAASHDIFIIAGDLFDSAVPLKDDLELVNSLLVSLAESGTATLFTPGKSDQMSGGMLDADILSLPFTHIFEPRSFHEPHIYEKEGEKISFYGVPWLENGYALKTDKLSGDSFNFGIAYASFDEGDTDIPPAGLSINKNDLRLTGIDFYALGSNHFFKMFKIGTRIIAAYPGTPEAVNIDETGNRFVISFSVKDKEVHQIKRLAVNGARIIFHEIDCSMPGAVNKIKEILENNRSPRNVLHLKLTGEKWFDLDEKDTLPYEADYCGIHIDDFTTPSVIKLIDEILPENSLRGEFFSIIRDKLEIESGSDTAAAAVELLKPMIDYDIKSLEELLCGL